MVGKTKSATKAQQERFSELQRIGCIACNVSRLGFRHAEIHHITRSGRRMGHDYTIPLCAWCHRAVPDGNLSPSDMDRLIGPSLARNKRRFVEVYGTELELLERVENLREKHGTH